MQTSMPQENGVKWLYRFAQMIHNVILTVNQYYYIQVYCFSN